MTDVKGITLPVRPRILIVDDTPLNIHLLAQSLHADYDVMISPSGRHALGLLQREKPDLIILDIMMPEMSGYDVCRVIKDDPANGHIPIIFVSARDSIEDQQRGFDLGAVDFIAKPFQTPLVLARVAVHLRLKYKSERLEQLAMLDGLTDIANRRALDAVLVREYGRAARDRYSLAVLMLDIDFFKCFNDHYGHGVGDACLRQVARACAAGLRRPGDFIARYGGEEFCVVLPDCNTSGAVLVAEALRANVRALQIAHAVSPLSDKVTISVGGSARRVTVAFTEASAATIHREADEALYLAKSQGRDRVVIKGVHL